MSLARRRKDRTDSGEYSDASYGSDNRIVSGNEGGEDCDSEYGSGENSGSDLSERERGDGQESERRVDDDEDRRNPQYIPKRGTFYEHDDRTAPGGDEEGGGGAGDTVPLKEVERVPPSEGAGDSTPASLSSERRKPRQDRWSHDKYNENEQAPKSSEELMAVYGYDIRGEEGPPRAFRRRRYGRGPNKYTRNWEDEEAYGRGGTGPGTPGGLRTPRGPPTVTNGDEFPALQAKNERNRMDRRRNGGDNRQRPSEQEALEPELTEKIIPEKATSPRGRGEKFTTERPETDKERRPRQPQRVEPRRSQPAPRPQQEPAKREAAPAAEPVQRTPAPPAPSTGLPAAALSSQDKKLPPARKANQVPPRMQSGAPAAAPAADSGARGKRYSSLRQRPMPDAYQPHQQVYITDYQQQPANQTAPQQTISNLGTIPHRQTPPPLLQQQTVQHPSQHHQPPIPQQTIPVQLQQTAQLQQQNVQHHQQQQGQMLQQGQLIQQQQQGQLIQQQQGQLIQQQQQGQLIQQQQQGQLIQQQGQMIQQQGQMIQQQQAKLIPQQQGQMLQQQQGQLLQQQQQGQLLQQQQQGQLVQQQGQLLQQQQQGQLVQQQGQLLQQQQGQLVQQQQQGQLLQQQQQGQLVQQQQSQMIQQQQQGQLVQQQGQLIQQQQGQILQQQQQGQILQQQQQQGQILQQQQQQGQILQQQQQQGQILQQQQQGQLVQQQGQLVQQQQQGQLLQQQQNLVQQQQGQLIQQQGQLLHQQTPPPLHQGTPPPQALGRQAGALPMRQVPRAHQQPIPMHTMPAMPAPTHLQGAGLVATQSYAAPPMMPQAQYIQSANGAVYGHTISQVYPTGAPYVPPHAPLPPQPLAPPLPPPSLPPPPQTLPPTLPPPHPAYHHPTPAPPHQPPYQPHVNTGRSVFREPSGITYYSPQEQKGAPPPTRRPTNAIPIVPPPARGRGRLTDAAAVQKDNIDHIVDNMFVPRHQPRPGPARPGETPPRTAESTVPKQFDDSVRQSEARGESLTSDRSSKESSVENIMRVEQNLLPPAEVAVAPSRVEPPPAPIVHDIPTAAPAQVVEQLSPEGGVTEAESLAKELDEKLAIDNESSPVIEKVVEEHIEAPQPEEVVPAKVETPVQEVTPQIEETVVISDIPTLDVTSLPVAVPEPEVKPEIETIPEICTLEKVEEAVVPAATVIEEVKAVEPVQHVMSLAEEMAASQAEESIDDKTIVEVKECIKAEELPVVAAAVGGTGDAPTADAPAADALSQ